MKSILYTLIFLIFPWNAYAIFCPSNFNNIDFGDTIEKVLQQCGEPASQNTYSVDAPTAQQWDYYLKISPLARTNSKMSLVFKDNQIINMTVNIDASENNLLCQETLQKSLSKEVADVVCNQSTQKTESISWTTICGPMIRIGDSSDKVKAACGTPDFITKSESDNQKPPTQMTEYKYDVPSPNTLIFENGVLKDRK